MDKEIDEAIKILTSLITRGTKSDDALRLSQAALNLAHIKKVLDFPSTWGGLGLK